MSEPFFPSVEGPISYGGLDSTDPFTYKVYQPDRLVLGRRMEEHLRIGVCLWHSFAWAATDMFGLGTFDRPWIAATDQRSTPGIFSSSARFASASSA